MNNVDRKKEQGNPSVKKMMSHEQLISIFEVLIYIICGFLFSRGTIFGTFAPLGVAFAAAVPKKGLFLASCAIIASSMFPTEAGDQFRYLAASVVIIGVRWALGGIRKLVDRRAFAPLIVFITLMFTGFAVRTSGEIILSDIVLITAESILAAGAAFFIRETAVLLEYKRHKYLKDLSSIQYAYIIIALGLLAASASSIQVEGMAPARALIVTAVLIASYIFKETGGSIAGIISGISISLTGSGMMFFGGAYAFGGLMSGVFSHVGKIAASLAFIMASVISGVISGGGTQVITGIYETVIGCILFLCIPKAKLNRFIKSKVKEKEQIDDLAFKKAVSVKLRGAALAVEEVSNAVEKASKNFKALSERKQQSISDKVKDKVCMHCQNNKMCHEINGRIFAELFDSAENMLKQNGTITTEMLPMRLTKRCRKTPELTAAFNSIYDEQLFRLSADRRINETREMMSGQLKGVTGLLADLCVDINDNEKYDSAATDKVVKVMSKMGIEVDDACCIIDNSDRVGISAYTGSPINENLDKIKLSDEISKAVGRRMGEPEIIDYDNTTLINIREKTQYSVKLGAAQHPYKGGKICGDSYECFNDVSGNSVMVISDGMGTGKYAAVDGTLTSGILARLIKAGFSYDSALKIINSAILVKSSDESLATVDIASINLNSGNLNILKAGAPPTLIRREGRVERVDCSSLPVGILNDICFEKSNISLKKGDILLMFSDGALGGGTEWLEQELICFTGKDVQMLAERIVRESASHRVDGRDDDVTVLTAIIE